jgi:hypothetical protein
VHVTPADDDVVDQVRRRHRFLERFDVDIAFTGGFGGYMGQHMSHWVGGTQNDAAGLWLMKWSRDGGDLRVAHFFGIHAMQVLPMFSALLPRAWPARTAIVVVVGAAAVYAAATTFTFVQAIDGLPFV